MKFMILKKAVGNAPSVQSFEPESHALERAFPIWECSPSSASFACDSESKSCTAIAFPTALFRIIICLLFFVPLEGANRTKIEADSADYDGKKIRMCGKVFLQHEFGNIRCEKAVMLMKEGSDKRIDPERILLYGNVQVGLRDGSVLHADEADINCMTLEGVFTAEAPNKVSYLTRIEEEGKSCPVKTTSRAMRVIMKRENKEYVIHDLQAEGAVNIEYQQES